MSIQTTTTQPDDRAVATEPMVRPVPLAAPRPSGPAAAAVLAAGIGSFTLGLMVVLSEASAAVGAALTWSAAVGPLSGKTGVTVLVWLVAWLALGLAWKGRDVDFGKVWTATLVLIVLGFLGTFPLFFDLFAAG